jgi:hypothetical protein
MKTAVQEALRGQASEGVEAVFPGSAPTTAPVFRYRGLKGTTGARPSFGQYGLYANTTTNQLQRDSGSAWEDIATLIPSGTKMVFYQASAPTGWTAVAANDKFLRVVTAGGTGGTTGGTHAASTSLAHTHSVPYSSWTQAAGDTKTGGTLMVANGSGTVVDAGDHTCATADNTSGSAFTGSFAYADVIIATKD